ncbi:MAG: phosphatase PAP2 family protein [Phycisphaerae bacterium]|nr:phosphatase PAP2 family protein [Phycisphaerae bacterium]
MVLCVSGTGSTCDELSPFLTILDPAASSWVQRWNRIAIDTAGLDHTPVAKGEIRTFGHQLGPGRSSRAMAIVHIAIFDAINAIVGEYESYTGIDPAPPNTSMKAAVSQAAHDTLIALYPSHANRIAEELASDLEHIAPGQSRENGIELGHKAAAAILALRQNDGAELPEDYVFSDEPGHWRRDPINPDQASLGSQWGKTQTFVLSRADQFRCPPPPPMTSKEYADAYAEAKEVGGDGITTPTVRTPEQSEIGIFWAYDGTPSLCAPPRLYNQIAVQIARKRGLNVVEMGRLLALVNIAMADAGVAIWESKYYYNFWRPVTAIRESDPNTGPTGLGDGNPDTVGDVNFTPFGAPLTNGSGPNFTPPFPAYPSGHAGFGGALFETLRNYFGTDNIPFTFVSDELNGETRDSEGNVRPLVPRTFNSLSEAEEENGQSRIYLGIHWRFDKVEGIVQGNRVADFVFANVYQPIR